MQEIKVTRCMDCPMAIEVGNDNCYECKKDAFGYLYYIHLERGIHPNCPIKGETITFKIGENE
jgi:hypothetical protein